jgi:hypothetical protein
MQPAIETTKTRTNRNVPVEPWPESVEILRYQATQSKPVSIKEISHDVGALEISTRNRLARLDVLGAVTASRAVSILGPGRQVVCAHFDNPVWPRRDCAATRKPNAINAARPCVKSVFALAQAMNLRT